MKAVGIRELKARLSEYVRLVKAGETVLVTERNEVVAELRPSRRQERPGTLRDWLEEEAEKGQVTLRAEDSGSWTWPAFRSGRSKLPPGMTSQDLLDAEREDRDP